MKRIAITRWIVVAIAVCNVAADPLAEPVSPLIINVASTKFDGSDCPITAYFFKLHMCKTYQDVRALLMREPDWSGVTSAGCWYGWREDSFSVCVDVFDGESTVRVISREMNVARFFESVNFGMAARMPW